MKSRFVFLFLVFTVCILSGCGAGHNARMNVDFSSSDAAQTAESGAVVVAEDGASTLHMLGATNKYGWYQVGYDETDVWYGTVIDFAEAEEREISLDEVKDFAECGLCGTAAWAICRLTMRKSSGAGPAC